MYVGHLASAIGPKSLSMGTLLLQLLYTCTDVCQAVHQCRSGAIGLVEDPRKESSRQATTPAADYCSNALCTCLICEQVLRKLKTVTGVFVPAGCCDMTHPFRSFRQGSLVSTSSCSSHWTQTTSQGSAAATQLWLPTTSLVSTVKLYSAGCCCLHPSTPSTWTPWHLEYRGSLAPVSTRR